MSADQLRRAAELLRKHAEAATVGPWRVTDKRTSPGRVLLAIEHTWDRSDDPDDPGREEVARIGVATLGFRYPAHEAKADAAYIALMHPAVGLAVVGLFVEVADSLEQDGDVVQDSTTASAVALARAILRETP